MIVQLTTRRRHRMGLATLVEPFIRHLEALLDEYEGVDAPSLTGEAQGHIDGAPNVVLA